LCDLAFVRGQYEYKIYVYEQLVGKVLSLKDYNYYLFFLVDGVNDMIVLENVGRKLRGEVEYEVVNLVDEAYEELHDICRDVRQQLRFAFFLWRNCLVLNLGAVLLVCGRPTAMAWRSLGWSMCPLFWRGCCRSAWRRPRAN